MTRQESPSNEKKSTFYKYKSVENYIHFTDIILNNRLFASLYPHLNDPMEGHYSYKPNKLSADIRQLIRCEKNSLRVCCLSEKCDDPLMWAHYADGNCGVMIEVEICGEQPIHMTYKNKLPNPKGVERREPSEVAKEVLSFKLKAWSYEDEYRVFSAGSTYIPIKLKKVVLGSRMPTDQKELIEDLINRLNETVIVEPSSIGVIRR